MTDTHIRGTTPKNRKDNLPETLERKLKEIGEIIKDYNIDFVLFILYSFKYPSQYFNNIIILLLIFFIALYTNFIIYDTK